MTTLREAAQAFLDELISTDQVPTGTVIHSIDEVEPVDNFHMSFIVHIQLPDKSVDHMKLDIKLPPRNKLS